jgi:dinuclear metal center YbgI/SA1388 family protein
MEILLKDLISYLEKWAHPSLQESYDNSGLITGDPQKTIKNALVTLDITEKVMAEAIQKQCDLIIAHHPIIFKPLSKITGENEVERVIISAIKNDIAIYAMHTNLDNVHTGVNAKLAQILELNNTRILQPKDNQIYKLITFVPEQYLETVKKAVFRAGAGNIGHYDECSFSSQGKGSFRAGKGTTPYVGQIGTQHIETEIRIEVVIPKHLLKTILHALKAAHPYEEVAYDIFPLINTHPEIGSGMIGELKEAMTLKDFVEHLRKKLGCKNIRHTLSDNNITSVAICGGAGSFLINTAKSAGADAYVTGDIKYHDFFESSESFVIADVGHYESEFFTKELIQEQILKKFPTFAILLSEINTNPINYT